MRQIIKFYVSKDYQSVHMSVPTRDYYNIVN